MDTKVHISLSKNVHDNRRLSFTTKAVEKPLNNRVIECPAKSEAAFAGQESRRNMLLF